jgi:hypothetical protein
VLAPGRLRYIAAERATLCVGTPLAIHKVLHLTFYRDGLFVQCPYFRSSFGIASRAEIMTPRPPHTLRLDEHGRVTSHLVKLAHHVDGAAHFSQDGQVRTEIRRQSFRLDTSIGSIFQMFAFWLRGFEITRAEEMRQDRAWIQFRMDDQHIFGVSIEGEWRRRAALEANIEPGDGEAGPQATLIHRRTGEAKQSFFLAPPAGSSLDSHILVLTCRQTAVPSDVTEPLLILLGGWDPSEIREGETSLGQTGCLVALYPVQSPDELAKRIGSIDFQPPTRAEEI